MLTLVVSSFQSSSVGKWCLLMLVAGQPVADTGSDPLPENVDEPPDDGAPLKAVPLDSVETSISTTQSQTSAEPPAVAGRNMPASVTVASSPPSPPSLSQSASLVGGETDIGNGDLLSGRRIVELSLVATRLDRGCYGCNATLHLIDCKKEVKHGFASVLHVKCRECGAVNLAQTSKTHVAVNSRRRVYDVNTKVSLGKCVSFFSPSGG